MATPVTPAETLPPAGGVDGAWDGGGGSDVGVLVEEVPVPQVPGVVDRSEFEEFELPPSPPGSTPRFTE